MTIQGILRRVRGGRPLRPTTSVALMGALVASIWTIVPSNDKPVHATGKPAVVNLAAPGSEAPPAPQAGQVVADPAAPGQPPAPQLPPLPPAWAAGLPPAGVAWSPFIQEAAAKEGLDPRLLASLVRAESAFDAAAVSPVGALGLAQLMPGTAAELGVDPLNPVQNLAGGAQYLKENLVRFGSTDLALAAYNAGPGRVAEVGGVPAIPETVQYVDKVLDFYRGLAQ